MTSYVQQAIEQLLKYVLPPPVALPLAYLDWRIRSFSNMESRGGCLDSGIVARLGLWECLFVVTSPWRFLMQKLIVSVLLSSVFCFAQSAMPMDFRSTATDSDVTASAETAGPPARKAGGMNHGDHIIVTGREQPRMAQEKTGPAPVYQLRIYEVSSNLRDVFHKRFQDHAHRIMKRYGFRVVAMWESTSVFDFEFVYILKWPDAATMERQWKLFLADSEWIEIKKKTVSETGEPVLRVSGRVLNAVEYSPAFNPG